MAGRDSKPTRRVSFHSSLSDSLKECTHPNRLTKPVAVVTLPAGVADRRNCREMALQTSGLAGKWNCWQDSSFTY